MHTINHVIRNLEPVGIGVAVGIFIMLLVSFFRKTD